MTVRACSLCVYFTPGASRGECHAHPQVVMKAESDWCGEFEKKAAPGEPHPSETSGSTKPKRLREGGRIPGPVIADFAKPHAMPLTIPVTVAGHGYDANGSPVND